VTIARYHIFSGLSEDALWVEAVDSLRNAYRRMKKLAAAFPGPYFIYSAETYKIVATFDRNTQRQESHHFIS